MKPILHRNAACHGLTRDQLRSAFWAHPADGVALETADLDDLDSVCKALLLILPTDVVFTHLTSGRLRRWWLPDLPGLPLIACTDGEAPHHNRRGVYIRRCEMPPGHRSMVRGIPVASAEWTIIELSEHFGLIDLVIVIDCALHRNEVTVESIRATMVRGRRGVRVLRRALELCNGKSESPWESTLRLLFELSGIRVDPQVVLKDARDAFVARADLLIRGTKRIAEYDGAGHRERGQHRDDLRREKACARIGYERFGYTDIEIRKQPALVVRDGENALGLRHDPSRLKFWCHEFEHSSLSYEGRRELIRRLRRFAREKSPRPTRNASGANL